MFIHSSVYGHLSCFHFLPIMNKAAVNFHVNTFSVLLSLRLVVELLDHMITLQIAKQSQQQKLKQREFEHQDFKIILVQNSFSTSFLSCEIKYQVQANPYNASTSYRLAFGAFTKQWEGIQFFSFFSLHKLMIMRGLKNLNIWSVHFFRNWAR